MRVGLIVVPLLLAGCACDDKVVQRVPQLYGRGAAVVFVRNCGATTAYATHVGIVRHVDAMPRKQEVVVVLDANHGAAPAGQGGGPEVRVRWLAANHLEVAHHPRARTFREKTQHGPVRISYVPLP